MKILIVHNLYGDGAPSGENFVYHEELRLLRSKNHQVHCHEINNSDLVQSNLPKKLLAGISWVFNLSALLKFYFLVNKVKPDVIHVHNLFPKYSPSILYRPKKYPLIMTLHNYRLICPSAQLRVGASVCLQCIEEKYFFPSLRNKCFRGSWLMTFPLMLSSNIHKLLDTWNKRVDRFIALTEFQKSMMVAGGINGEKISVRPNYFTGTPKLHPFHLRSHEVAFVGRISEEKGVNMLCEVWEKLGKSAPILNVVGSGPDYIRLREQYSRCSNIKFHGKLDQDSCFRILSRSKFMIVPSLWFEGFPMVIREAFAHGVPVVASNIGSLNEIISRGGGVTFEAANPESLSMTIKNLMNDDTRLNALSQEAHDRYVTEFSVEINYKKLIEIYDMAITGASSSGY